MKNITYILSDIEKALAFEWIVQRIDRKKYNLSFILMNKGDSPLENFLKQNNVPVKRITYNGKKDMPKAFTQILFQLKKFKTQCVHCHAFDATVAGLPAAKLAGVKQRIYTRHHSDLHHTYHPSGIKYDRMNNRLATHIIAISPMVKKILMGMEHVPAKKITLMPHGFKLEDFDTVDAASVERLTIKYNPQRRTPVIGVIARHTAWKGIQNTIPAFEKLLLVYPNALLILANASGDYKREIDALLSRLPKESYCEIKFENELFPLYKLFNVFVHVPISPIAEAYGQTYVEALASGIPSVFTLSGIAQDFVVDKHNALVVDFNNSGEIYDALMKLLSDETLRTNLIANGKKDVRDNYHLDKMMKTLDELYA